MNTRSLLLLGAVALFGAPVQGGAQTLGEAMAHIRAGRYEEGIDLLESLGRGPGASVDARRSYARALMEVGRYDEAREAVEGAGAQASSPELETVYGETLSAVGRIEEAEAAFTRAVSGNARDRHVARLNQGILLWKRGDREAALSLFDTFIDLYNNSSGSLSAEELMAVGTAVQYMGVTSPVLFQDAIMAFEGAADADPDDPTPELLIGELFLRKYDATDARESFGRVLEGNPENPRAFLGMARVLDFEGVGGARQAVTRALEVNPNYVEAMTFLAGLHLKTAEYARAREKAGEALKINPVDPEAMSVLAASHFLLGDTTAYEKVLGEIHALYPEYAGVYAVVAEHTVNQRMYQTAVELAERAVELDPTFWQGYGILGMNQLRTGKIEEGRANLETAFEGDPANVWYYNTLNLLDTFVHYETVATQHFELMIHEREVGLLGPYAAEAAEEAFSRLRERYGIEPPTPVRLEIFPSHSDFSVRTLGLTGLGALGVSFGSTLVMDSPSAQDVGEFNWISTMWHEVAHAFHLAMSEHRVPRWFTEGLAVHEQRVARERWGHKASPAWLRAYAAGNLHPVSRLDRGFIQPEYPEQVVFSYYQASLVFDLIEDQWGLDAILGMLRGFAQGATVAEAFEDVLGMSPAEFDEEFDEYVQLRWGNRIRAVTSAAEEVRPDPRGPVDVEILAARAMANPGSFQARLDYGKALFAEESMEEAETEFRAALSLFPEYGGRDSPYLFLARIEKVRGDSQRAARTLRQLGGLSETLFPVHLEEAELWMELGDSRAAAEALRKAVEIIPWDVEPHRKLAELYGGLGETEGAVLERRALLALDPPDRAEAHYLLAVALKDSGERDEARTQVLRALEIAPSYDEALELLLELRKGGR